MTPQQLYQKVLNEEMSQSQFLFQIRRDEGLSSFITNTNTYDQTIVQLKNRGHIFDINEAKEESFDLLGSIKVLTEATKKPKLDQDHANDYEFQQGWRYELDDMKEPDFNKAKEKALKNIQSDANYYTRLLLLKTKKPTKRTDQPIEINASKTNVVDKDNAVKPVKGIEKDKTTPKGSAEKATKPKGVKTMKGGPGEMKTISEGKKPFPGNKLKGGKGDKLSINDVDRAEFKKGIKHEMEHTTDPKIAAEIALDHIAENPKYYSEIDKTGIDESDDRYDRFNIKVNKPDYQGTIKMSKKGWMLYDKSGSPEESGPFNTVQSLMSYYDIEKKYLSGEYVKNLRENIFSSVDKPVKGKEVSFTVEDHSDPNKKLQIKKTVKSGKKSKDGTFELSFTQGDKLIMTKTNQGVTSLYFENPSDAKIHDKVVDLDKGLATLADKIFPKDKAVNENDIIKTGTFKKTKLRDIIKDLPDGTIFQHTSRNQGSDEFWKNDTNKFEKTGPLTFKSLSSGDHQKDYDLKDIKSFDFPGQIKIIKSAVNEYADGEEDDYDEIEDSYGTPEIKSILNKYDNLGFDLPGEAMNAILTDKDFARNYDFDNNQPDVQKLTAWRDSIVKKKKAHEALRESLKKIIRKKLYEQDIKGPTVKKNELNDLMKRYDWYYETSDNDSLKQRGQETHDKAMDLVNQLGDTGIEVFNSCAPDDCKITKSVNEDVQHYAKMSEFDSKEKNLIKAHIDTTETLDNCILVFKRPEKRLIIRDYPEVDKAVTIGKGLVEKESGKAYVITSFGTADVHNDKDVQEIKDNAKHAADFSESKSVSEESNVEVKPAKKEIIDFLNKYDSDIDSKKGSNPIVDIIYWGKKTKGNSVGKHSFTTVRKNGEKFDTHTQNRVDQDLFDKLGDKLEKTS